MSQQPQASQNKESQNNPQNKQQNSKSITPPPNPYYPPPPIFNFSPCMHYHPYCSLPHYEGMQPFYNYKVPQIRPHPHMYYPPMPASSSGSLGVSVPSSINMGNVKSQSILNLNQLQIYQINQLKKREELKRIVCQCVKSHCLKQYCYCFKSGAACGQKCGCNDCKNTQDQLNEKRNPFKLKRTQCRCSKSQCVKKYCECYSANKKCEQTCLCIGCQN